jgi:anti-sigma B factor antagonist
VLGPDVTIDELSGDPPVRVMQVHGELDLASGPLVREELARAASGAGVGLVVDLSECLFIDSTGISLLLNASRRLTHHDGELAVVCPGPTARRVFEITRTTDTLNVTATRAAALRRVGGVRALA